jgi:hypothetical protein
MSDAHLIDITAQLELAWAAGFFDGEGYSGVAAGGNGNEYSYFRMQIAQCHPECLHRFRAAVGGLGNVTGPRPPRGPNRQPTYWWTAGAETARKAIALLWPYLGSVKRAQAQEALDGEMNVGNGRMAPRVRVRDAQTHCPQGHEYTPENAGRTPRGIRYCKECKRVKRRAYTLRKKSGG